MVTQHRRSFVPTVSPIITAVLLCLSAGITAHAEPSPQPAASSADQMIQAPGAGTLPNHMLATSPQSADDPSDGSGDDDSEMVITLSAKTQRECSTGYVIEVYDDTATVHSSAPGAPLTVAVTSSWHGWVGVIARCGKRFWKDWSSFNGKTAQKAGVASITLDGIELATHDSLVCDDPWGPRIKPMVPLDSPNRGKCP